MRTTMRWSDTSYPAVRRVMGPEREHMTDEALEDLLGDLFPEAVPGDVEDFMRSLQTFGKQVAPLAQRALPGVIKGATTGATVAGPWGAVAGAIGGGAASLLGGGGAQSAPRPAPPTPRPPTPQPPAPGPMALQPAVTPPAPVAEPSPPAPVAAPPAGAAAVAGTAAPAQLLALLSRPETMQALLSMVMAGAGRSAIRVGAQTVPAPAFANAISELAEEAAFAATPGSGAASGYLYDSAGNPRCDVASPAERASLLLADVAAAADEAEEPGATADALDDSEWSEADEAFEESDPLDSYEAALEGRQAYG
jgi:hypothetical protein